MIVEWRKACKCLNAGAETGNFRVEVGKDSPGGADSVLLLVTFDPRLICIKCFTPWTRTERDGPDDAPLTARLCVS